MSDRLKVKVAVYLILVKDNKVLFERRKNTGWMDGKLSLPSGHVDPGELPKEAALRELYEETGLKVNFEDIGIRHISYRRDNYVDFYFIVNKWKGEPTNLEPEKCSEQIWVDIANPNDEFADSVLESTQRAFLKDNFYSEFEL